MILGAGVNVVVTNPVSPVVVVAAPVDQVHVVVPVGGSPGPTGPAGAGGNPGPAGPQGPQGDPGSDGVDGSDGLPGATGPVGPQGPAGEDGADGATGPAGADSTVPGPQGPAGPQGIQGVAGPAGPAGADGLDGATGATGPQGIPGVDGTDGVDGAPGAPGATGADGADGLDGATGAQGPIGLSSPELYDRASDHASGTPGPANTGQTPILSGYTSDVSDVLAKPKFSGGRLITDATTSGNLGSFWQVNLPNQVTYQKASWVFTAAGTANTGTMGIISWAPGFTGTPTAPPESNCHLSIYPTGWTYAIIYLGVFYNMGSGTFAVPLAQDGTTVHTCEVVHDITSSSSEVIYLYLPDGSVQKMTTLAAATPTATQAAFEIYKNANADKNVEIIDWSADSRLSERPAQARRDFAEYTKLAGVANNATANSSDAYLLARANHTGTQALSTLTTTGTANSTTYLRGDGAWSTPAGGSVADGTYLPNAARKSVLAAYPNVGAAVSAYVGTSAFTATGTATQASYSSTTAQTLRPRVEYLVTTPATTAVGGWRMGNVVLHRGANPGQGGFLAEFRFGPATGQAIAGRMFTGLTASVAAPTDAEPSTQIQIIGVGYDAADTQLYVMHNDASGTATRVATGLTRSSVDREKVYRLTIGCAANASTMTVTILDEITGTSFTTTPSTDLPPNTVFLGGRSWCSVGGVSSVIGMTLFGFYAELT